MNLAQRHRGEQGHRVKMAGVVADQNVGTCLGQMAAALDMHPMVDTHPATKDQRGDGAYCVREHVWLAWKIPQSLGHRRIDVG